MKHKKITIMVSYDETQGEIPTNDELESNVRWAVGGGLLPSEMNPVVSWDVKAEDVDPEAE